MNSSYSQCTNIAPTHKKIFTTKGTKITKITKNQLGIIGFRGELLSTFRIADE